MYLYDSSNLDILSTQTALALDLYGVCTRRRCVSGSWSRAIRVKIARDFGALVLRLLWYAIDNVWRLQFCTYSTGLALGG